MQQEYNVTKKMITITAALFLTMVFSAGIFAQDSQDSLEADSTEAENAEATSTDIASVNGSIIDSDEVKREMNIMFNRATQQGIMPDESEIKTYWAYALNNLINREILFQEAKSSGYAVDEEQVDQYIAYLVQNSGGEEQMLANLEENGLDVETVRDSTGEYFVISEYVTEVFSPAVIVEDSEVRKFYDENQAAFTQEEMVTARHILFLVEEGAEMSVVDETKERLVAVRERIMAGEDFGEVAMEVSEGPSSTQGGFLGEFGRGRMVAPFEDAAFALEAGELSEPVFTQFGWHLIEVLSKQEGGLASLEDVEPKIKEYLSNVALEEKVNLHVEGVKENYEIIIFQ